MRKLLLMALLASPAAAQDTTALRGSCAGGDIKACQQGAKQAGETLNASAHFFFVDQGCKYRDARACATLGDFYRKGTGTRQNYPLGNIRRKPAMRGWQ